MKHESTPIETGMRRKTNPFLFLTNCQEFFRELNKRGEFWIGLERKGKRWSTTWEWVDGSPLAHT